MSELTTTSIPMYDNKTLRAEITVTLLPGQDRAVHPSPLIVSEARLSTESLARVQLLEGHEYRYHVDTTAEEPLTVEPRDLFYPDDPSGRSGRLRTSLATGRVQVQCFTGRFLLGRGEFEVRSRKLAYLSDYRWMLRDIAEAASELIMERFAPSAQRFRPEGGSSARTLYQRFEFLRALISGAEFTEAIQQVLARPYVMWSEEIETRRVGASIPARSSVMRELVRPGPRVRTSLGGSLETLPSSIRVLRTEATVDNPANRFVKFALTAWRDTIEVIRRVLSEEESTFPVQRGLQEVTLLENELESLLGHELFRDVGTLEHFPTGNQVLQKREGYREVLRAFVQWDLASKLAWNGGEDVYWAGQRNVAALYEYWSFFQLATVISDLSNRTLDLDGLIRTSPGGLALSVTRGEALAARGTVQRLARTLHIHLWFNKTFSKGGFASGSWSRPMRPDVSLLIDVPDSPTFRPVWIHFDAKYRVDSLRQILGAPTDLGDEEVPDNEPSGRQGGRAMRSDLLKMHAYRDAIRRSAGAYVLYPGDSEERIRAYHELLPGLGAFVLRPSASGQGEGLGAIHRFLDDVLAHVASQASAHERERYWVDTIHTVEQLGEAPKSTAVPFLSRPPADTQVLLGYVRSRSHLDWIHAHRLYNLRADGRTGSVGLHSRELGAELVILYGNEIDPEVWTSKGSPHLLTAARMRELQYPNPRGDLYLCLNLGDNVTAASGADLSLNRIRTIAGRTARPWGSPVATTWLALVE
jgi:predicted component of viral defense system (DUF524 family)